MGGGGGGCGELELVIFLNKESKCKKNIFLLLRRGGGGGQGCFFTKNPNLFIFYFKFGFKVNKFTYSSTLAGGGGEGLVGRRMGVGLIFTMNPNLK